MLSERPKGSPYPPKRVSRELAPHAQRLAKFAKLDVLVLDDFLITPLSDTERRDLLEVIEHRYDKSSTVITSQLPNKKWHQMLPTIADASATASSTTHTSCLFEGRRCAKREESPQRPKLET